MPAFNWLRLGDIFCLFARKKTSYSEAKKPLLKITSDLYKIVKISINEVYILSRVYLLNKTLSV